MVLHLPLDGSVLGVTVSKSVPCVNYFEMMRTFIGLSIILNIHKCNCIDVGLCYFKWYFSRPTNLIYPLQNGNLCT